LAEWLRQPPDGIDEHRLAQLLRPSPDATLAVQAVSKRVNKPGNDEPACIEPIPTPPEQGSLFEGF
jgi:putative SOS response-associated peptidase YedK